jgi:predicted Zn-dependent peptidase
MRVESDPAGKLWNTLIRTAFSVHPYRNGPGGWPADIENFRLKDALEFRNRYYVPSNMVISIVGDVDPKEMRRLADKYFAGLPPGPPPPPVVSQDPEQEGERRVTVESPTQPFLMVGYKRPDTFDKDDPVFDVIQEILSSGRTGMLYKDLVRDKKLALAAQASSAFPANKYSCLFFLFAVPNAGKTVEEVEKALYETVEKLKKEKVDAATLNRVKTKLRAGLIRGLDSNDGMALQMAMAHTMYGSWKKLFDAIEDINKVTADDVQRVAQKYFVEKSRTVAYNVQPKKAEAPAGGAN